MLDDAPGEQQVVPRRRPRSRRRRRPHPRVGAARGRAPAPAGRRARAGSRVRPSRARAARDARARAGSAWRRAARPLGARTPGAKRTSTNCAASASASGAVTCRLRTTTPPYAETGSAASAPRYASSTVSATATPHGFACFTITHAGRSSSWARSARGGEVVQVVEGEVLALELLHEREQVRPGAPLRVVGGVLLRILPVREVERALEGRHERLREILSALEPARDRRLVGGRPREGDRPPDAAAARASSSRRARAARSARRRSPAVCRRR